MVKGSLNCRLTLSCQNQRLSNSSFFPLSSIASPQKVFSLCHRNEAPLSLSQSLPKPFPCAELIYSDGQNIGALALKLSGGRYRLNPGLCRQGTLRYGTLRLAFQG
ncbi:hypothetical protein FGO68_gene3294 [Halteria grandinella]|uniref:Uncharacterized protein n=1 Tax=Halteria grandinella TaxID=5974 RepID=A0A8J8NXI6_HALGN|nr:hypothetical protein FGO68_gene3294 [Halteria grandinella]